MFLYRTATGVYDKFISSFEKQKTLSDFINFGIC